MKKGIKIAIIVIVLCVLVFAGLYFGPNLLKKDKPVPENKDLISISSYFNGAGTVKFSGSALFSDGSIYTWNFSGDEFTKGGYNLNTLEGVTNYILDRADESKNVVSESDLNTIKEYINNLTEEELEFKEDCRDTYNGTNTIEIVKDKEIIAISETGDCNGSASSENAQELITILNKIFKGE